MIHTQIMNTIEIMTLISQVSLAYLILGCFVMFAIDYLGGPDIVLTGGNRL